MKCPRGVWRLSRLAVAPCAGAWIEIAKGCINISKAVSPPARGRGLKYGSSSSFLGLQNVAPCAGAWIEMGCV